MVDLKEYFNNKGLSNKDNYKNANLSITGYSIPVERRNGGEPFLNSMLAKDNIECFGQEIELETSKHTKEIEFCGVGIQGDVKAEVVFITKEGYEIKKKVCFSAFDFEKPFFKENTPVYKSTYLYNCYSEHNPKVERTGIIWKNEVKFNEVVSIKKIILPFHPGLHIFAVNIKGDLSAS